MTDCNVLAALNSKAALAEAVANSSKEDVVREWGRIAGFVHAVITHDDRVLAFEEGCLYPEVVAIWDEVVEVLGKSPNVSRSVLDDILSGHEQRWYETVVPHLFVVVVLNSKKQLRAFYLSYNAA